MIKNLYYLSGIVNTAGLLAFNRGYTGAAALANMAPSLFSTESQMLINVWGLAYIAAAKNWKQMPELSLVFCVEKMLYVWWWYRWIKDDTNRHSALSMVTSGSDVLTGGFLLVFGLNDLLFGLIFGRAAYVGFQERSKNAKNA